MRKIKLILAGLLVTSIATPCAFAEGIDLKGRLLARQELVLATDKIRPYLFDEKVLRRLNAWLTHPKNESFVVDCQTHLRAFIHSNKILGPLCYFLRQDDKEKRALYSDFVKRYLLEVKAALFEIKDFPNTDLDTRYTKQDQVLANRVYSLFKTLDEKAILDCFQPAMKVSYEQGFKYSPFQEVAHCLNSFPKVEFSDLKRVFFSVNIATEFGKRPGHAVSPTGWIRGNKVTYLVNNAYDDQITRYLEVLHPTMHEHYPLNGRGSYKEMLKADPKDVFTQEEGFAPVEQHPVWNQPQGSIFAETVASMAAAKESIFIDIFFLGGTMGASLAKYIVHLIEERPQLKVLILRDNINDFGHKAEMLPVYNFLRAYSFYHPDRLIISSANIKLHQSGLPSFMSGIVTDEFLEISGIQKHLSLYGRAVSDHSKVLVIDGASQHPVALVGSKNWTDSSGGNCYDEVAKVEGPGAAIVLDDYYYDMVAALEEDELLEHFAKGGWSPTNSNDRKQQIADILRPFDLLKRNRDGISQLKDSDKVTVEDSGEVVLRTGYNNVDSTRTNAVDQVIEAIFAARKNIFIKDQYLFDRNVVYALVYAKTQSPDLDIRVILDPLFSAPIPGMPNLLYIDILTKVGVEVRFKSVLRNSLVHQEYHMKTISVDGRYLISGSANKDQTTMYGSFREEQIDMVDPVSAAIHDEVFEDDWKNGTSATFRSFNFKVPGGLKGIDGEPLTPDEFIELIRNLISILFDAKSI